MHRLSKVVPPKREILKNISLSFFPGAKIGVLGLNGSGKSTLLKIMAGVDTEFDGEARPMPELNVGYLPQEPQLDPNKTVREVVEEAVSVIKDAQARLDQVYAEYAEPDADFDKLAAEQAKLEAILQASDGHNLERQLEVAADALRLPAWDAKVSVLSGGEKRRVALCRLLLSAPDMLLLDEPTNHLDINTIRWLENILTQRNSLMIIISHDRHFLNSVCTHMADLDYGELRLFPGNYDEYMTVATQSREQLLSDNAKKKAQISELQSFVSRFSANASKAKQATSRAKAIDKIQLAEVKPSSRVSPFIRFEQTKKLHRQAVIVDRMAKGFDGKTLFKDFSFQVEAGERVAIIGPNGIGKTTLLRTLVNELQPDAGTVKWTEAAEIGYYAQDHAHDFEDESTLFDWMGQWTQGGEQMVRGTLGRMLFSNDEILKSVKVISGGEQGRMLFGKLILQKPNVLVMDEPTNHLDMESIEALNLALENYPGTLIFVSHDREFVSSLATRIIELSPSGVIDFSGTYDDYLRSQGVSF
nr:ATP-binding cassette domain-containing protein [Pseudomonas savastanoi]